MCKDKYYYNHNTCSYERAKVSLKTLLIGGGMFLVCSWITAIFLVRIHHKLVISPREVELLEDNEKLKTYYRIVQQKLEQNEIYLEQLQKHDDTLYRILLDMDPLSCTERNAGIGGVDKYAHLSKEELIAKTLSKIDRLTRKLNIQKKSFEELIKKATKHSNTLRSVPTLPPVPKQYLQGISSGYGMRIHPIYKIHRMHEGIDFAALSGTSVYASANGYIKIAKTDKKGFGNHVIIDHGNGFQTLYAHMDSITVHAKQKVLRGQEIGTVGNSGHSTGPHLHYAVYHNNKLVDPQQYFIGNLSPKEYAEVKKQSEKQMKALCANF